MPLLYTLGTLDGYSGVSRLGYVPLGFGVPTCSFVGFRSAEIVKLQMGIEPDRFAGIVDRPLTVPQDMVSCLSQDATERRQEFNGAGIMVTGVVVD